MNLEIKRNYQQKEMIKRKGWRQYEIVIMAGFDEVLLSRQVLKVYSYFQQISPYKNFSILEKEKYFYYNCCLVNIMIYFKYSISNKTIKNSNRKIY